MTSRQPESGSNERDARGGAPSVSALLQQAQTLHQAGRPGEALRYYRQALAVLPERADVMVAAAAAAFQAGQPESAAQYLRAAIARAPDSAPAHCNLGNLMRAQGKLADAVAAYRRAVEIDPGFAAALANLGAVLEQLGRPDEAEATYRQALAVAPDAVPLLDSLGRALAKQVRYQAALDAHRRALAIDPTYAPAQFNIADVLQEQGALAEAEAAYDRALALDGNFAPGLNNLALVLQKLGRLAEAEARLRRAIEVGPDYATAHINLATVLFDRGAAADAVGACDAGLALEPGNGTAIAFKAIALAELGRRAAAGRLNDVERLLRQRPLTPPAGYASLAAYNGALAAQVAAVPDRFSEPGAKGGRQTRDLMVDPTGPLADFKALIDDAVGAYAQALPVEPAHPFLGRVPERWSLTAWGTLVSEIEPPEDSHIHPTAWASGVYYVALPEELRADDRQHGGWIEFGRPPRHIGHQFEPEITLVRPKEGLVLLFPSYFYHRVMPFKAAATRISIAFDVTPAG